MSGQPDEKKPITVEVRIEHIYWVRSRQHD